MKHPAYPKYRDSGVQWLSEVPEGWETAPLKYLAEIKNGYAFRSNDFIDEGIPLLRIGDITKEGYVDLSKAKFLPAEYGSFYNDVLVQKNDIVMAMTGATIGKVGKYQINDPALLNQRVCLFRSLGNNDQNYLWYVLNTQFYAEHITLTAFGGAQPNISDMELLACAVPIPKSNDEQTAIAGFLNRETDRIDTLVAKKRRLLELLEEKRMALISRTVIRGLPADVTREFGLDPHTRFKDSGIDWLGEVPEGWEIKKFGHISNIVRGASPRPAGDSRFFDGDFIPWITVGEVTKEDHVYLTSTETMLTKEGASHSRKIQSDTLILTNSGATLGVPKITSIKACANDGIVVFEGLCKNTDHVFLYYYLKSLTKNLRDRIKQGSGQPNLNTDIIKTLSVPLPPLPEQTAIATYLDRETAKIDQLKQKMQGAIARLQEYRTALITAAVTGKIDVREAGG